MYKAIICKVKVSPIPGADKIQLANCAGYTAIIGKNHIDSELGIFFPSDGQISKEMMKYNKLHRDNGGYLENNRRIKTIKLMGIKSEGIWLPISSLNWTKEFLGTKSKKLQKNSINLEKPIEHLREGDSLTHLNGVFVCCKYITNATKEKSVKSKSLISRFKSWWYSSKTNELNKIFPKHFDTENIRHVLNDRNKSIPVGIDCYVTIKLHGTSARSGLIKKETLLSKWFSFIKPKYEYFVGTRNLVLPHKSCEDIYRTVAHNLIKSKLRKDEIIYYEIVGYGENGKSIMQSHKISDAKIAKKFSDPMVYSYGMKPTEPNCTYPKYEENFDIYVYRITDHGINLSPQELQQRCKELNLKIVPFIQKIIWNGNTNKLLETCKLLSELNGGKSRIDSSHIEEGICLRFYGWDRQDQNDSDEGFKLFDMTVKYKSWLFCDCEGIAKNSDTYIDPEEIEE